MNNTPNKQEEKEPTEKQIDKYVSSQIPYSKKKCIDLAYEEGKAQTLADVMKIIDEWIEESKSRSKSNSPYYEIYDSYFDELKAKLQEIK